ncbi:hypothetical protein R4Z10_05840 [Niallia sp. XMNu-256]|uniref:hypothetical protein n=1 Tax=Niallia sp. XMNu-256 TaxID=3082444 RepID=UPI0030CE62E6
MEMEHIEKVSFHMENVKGELIVKGEISGKSNFPFHDDLKFKGIIALLNSIDKKNFKETNNGSKFNSYIKEIEETIDEMKKFEQFQGEVIE